MDGLIYYHVLGRTSNVCLRGQLTKWVALPYSTRYRWGVIKSPAAIGFAEIAAVESRLSGYR